jgi:hypothetical protein
VQQCAWFASDALHRWPLKHRGRRARARLFLVGAGVCGRVLHPSCRDCCRPRHRARLLARNMLQSRSGIDCNMLHLRSGIEFHAFAPIEASLCFALCVIQWHASRVFTLLPVCTVNHRTTFEGTMIRLLSVSNHGLCHNTEGTTISVISIKGDECNLNTLGNLADMTGGSVARVDPKHLAQTIAVRCPPPSPPLFSPGNPPPKRLAQ